MILHKNWKKLGQCLHKTTLLLKGNIMKRSCMKFKQICLSTEALVFNLFVEITVPVAKFKSPTTTLLICWLYMTFFFLPNDHTSLEVCDSCSYLLIYFQVLQFGCSIMTCDCFSYSFWDFYFEYLMENCSNK